jgi:predicted amidophosphoribosyltransferase
MSKPNKPPKAGTLKTFGRETSQKALGTLLIILGVIVLLGSLIGVKKFGPLGIFVGLVLFLILVGTGEYKRRKARHVAWTMEAIERERRLDGKQIKCPRSGHWNAQADNYCSDCSLPLKVKCVKCGSFVSRGTKFCSSCGSPVEKAAIDDRE